MIVGSFEVVDLPEFNISAQIAKIDTGAFSGAIHCTDIFIEDDTLYFTVLGDKATKGRTTHFHKRTVRSASGHTSERYIIDTTIVIQQKTYPITIGLSDRSTLKFPILIGRRFLRENAMIVDVRQNAQYDEGEVLE